MSYKLTEPSARLESLVAFYERLDMLRQKRLALQRLGDGSRITRWPERGVYFFMEPGQARSDSGLGLRVVRVGTHALREGSQSSLKGRLYQHRGNATGQGGNHRGSIFRLLIGLGLTSVQPALSCPSWGTGNTASGDIRAAERSLEEAVSRRIAEMPVLFLPILDEPGPASLRGYIERNAIALLSNYARPEIDPPSADWLGRSCQRDRVLRSGLWNNNHVDEVCDPDFLNVFSKLLEAA